MRMRKGQAALEFLTTYGWAFLVILVMIGALAGFGILSPKNLLPNRCSIGPELTCEEAAIWAGENVTVVIRNSMADSVVFDSDDVTFAYGDTNLAGCTVDGVSGTATTVSPGNTAVLSCTYDSTEFPPAGDKAKIAVEITFKPVGKTLDQRIAGELFQSVQ